MTVAELYEKVKAINEADLSREAVRQSEAGIIYLNQQQLLTGKKSDNSELGTYRPLTIAIRREKGRQTHFVDLFFEGNFQNAMYLITKGNQFDISSRDFKADKLQDKYGDAIFGLTEENKAKAWRDYVKDAFVGILAKRTGLPTS